MEGERDDRERERGKDGREVGREKGVSESKNNNNYDTINKITSQLSLTSLDPLCATTHAHRGGWS